MQVNILEAKSQLSQLLKSALAGEDVVIANRGEPVARLVAIDTPPARRATHPRRTVAGAPAARGGGILAWIDANPLPDYLRRSADEIDAAIAEERESWE